MQTLQRWRAGSHQFSTSGAIAREGDDVDARICGELRADLGTWSGDDIDHAGGEANLARQLCQP